MSDIKAECWPLVRLKSQTLKIGSGITPKGGSKVYGTSGVPFIRSQNVLENRLNLDDAVFITSEQHAAMASSRVQSGDVLLNITGASIGRSCVVRISIIEENVNQHVCIIRCDSGLEPGFLCQFLNSREGQKQILSFQAGGNREGLNYVQLGRLLIPCPSIQVQRKVASVLAVWDRAIAQTERLIASHIQFKRALVQPLFTRKKRLQEFACQSWEEVRLSTVFERVTRKNNDDNRNIVTVSAQRGFVRQNEFFGKFVASKNVKDYFLIKKGEFCYNKSYTNDHAWGSTKRLKEFEKAVVTTLYICFKIKDESKYSGDFFEQFFEACMLDKGLTKIAHEGGRAHGLLNVTPSDFFDLKISVPNYDEQIAIARLLQTTDRKIDLLTNQLKALKRQKRGLTQLILSGRIRVHLQHEDELVNV